MPDIPDIYKGIFVFSSYADSYDKSIADTLNRYVRIYPDYAKHDNLLDFLPDYEGLTVLQKTLLYFLIVRAMFVTGHRDDEVVRPVEIENTMRLNGGSVRPFLKRLSRKNNVTLFHDKEAHTYKLKDYRRAIIILS